MKSVVTAAVKRLPGRRPKSLLRHLPRGTPQNPCLDFSYLPEIQQNLHVITKSNLENYLELYKDDCLKVTVEELITMIRRSMECVDFNSEMILEGKALLLDLLIDFDKEEFYSNHLGMKNYERYVPNEWTVCSGRFDHLIPEEKRYWIEKNGKINIRS